MSRDLVEQILNLYTSEYKSKNVSFDKHNIDKTSSHNAKGSEVQGKRKSFGNAKGIITYDLRYKIISTDSAPWLY